MFEEITKNVSITTHILSTIGLIFLMMLICHAVGPYAYFTPYGIYQLPFWIVGLIVGYCGRQLYLSYRK